MKRPRQFPAQLLLATIIAAGFALGAYLLAGGTSALAIVMTAKSVPAERFVIGYTEEGERVFGAWQVAGPDEVRLACVDQAGVPIEEDRWSWATEVPAAASSPSRETNWIMSLEHQGSNENFDAAWYLDSGESAEPGAVFSAWSTSRARPVGFLGTAGFRKQPLAADERFADVLDTKYYWPHGMVLVLCKTQVYLADLGRRQTHLLLDQLATPPRLVSSEKFALRRGQPEPRGYRSYRYPGGHGMDMGAICNDDALTLFDLGPPNAFAELEVKVAMHSFPLPAEARGRTFSFAQHRNRTLTIAVADPPAFNATTQNERIYQLTEGKPIEAPREVELTRASGEERSVLWPAPLPLASPLIQAIGTVALGQQSWHDFAGMSGPTDYALALWWRDRWLLTWAGAAALALAAVCYRRQVRYQASPVERIVWPLFVFLLGLPGWIGYRFGRRWPVVEPCPACHKPVPRSAQACGVCHRGFPLPAMTGSEIFA